MAEICPARDAAWKGLCGECVVLPEPEDVVPCETKIAKEIRLLRTEEVVEAAMAANAGRPAGQHGATRSATHRILHMAVFEACALAGKRVEVGCARDRIPVAGQAVSPHLVRHEKNEIRSSCRLCSSVLRCCVAVFTPCRRTGRRRQRPRKQRASGETEECSPIHFIGHRLSVSIDRRTQAARVTTRVASKSSARMI